MAIGQVEIHSHAIGKPDGTWLTALDEQATRSCPLVDLIGLVFRTKKWANNWATFGVLARISHWRNVN